MMTTLLASLKPSMIYDKIIFPVFTIHTDDVVLSDGLLWIENKVVDDTNMKGETLGMRRLQSPMSSIYPLKYMIKDIPALLRHKGSYYIDNQGYVFTKEKTITTQLKYHKILRTDRKGIASILWVKDCPFPFTLDRPLKDTETWAGILYRQSMPWVLYSTSNKREKDSWRKI